MVDYLIEIIFKNVAVDEIERLLSDLTSNGQLILNYYHTLKSTDFSWDKEGSLRKLFTEGKEFGLFVNLKELNKKGVCLPLCGIAVYKYETEIEVNVNFQLSDLKAIDSEGLTKKLMKLAKTIATDYKIREYYCGIDPAQDLNLRLFTNEALGPISL